MCGGGPPWVRLAMIALLLISASTTKSDMPVPLLSLSLNLATIHTGFVIPN